MLFHVRTGGQYQENAMATIDMCEEDKKILRSIDPKAGEGEIDYQLSRLSSDEARENICQVIKQIDQVVLQDESCDVIMQKARNTLKHDSPINTCGACGVRGYEATIGKGALVPLGELVEHRLSAEQRKKVFDMDPEFRRVLSIFPPPTANFDKNDLNVWYVHPEVVQFLDPKREFTSPDVQELLNRPNLNGINLENDLGVFLCQSCNSMPRTADNIRMPGKYSIAKNHDYGLSSRVNLRAPTTLELHLIAGCRLYMVLIKLVPKGNWLTAENRRQGMKNVRCSVTGHNIAFFHNGNEAVLEYQELQKKNHAKRMPRSSNEALQTVKVCFSGGLDHFNTFKQAARENRASLCPAEMTIDFDFVIHCLKMLKACHSSPVYRNMIINETIEHRNDINGIPKRLLDEMYHIEKEDMEDEIKKQSDDVANVRRRDDSPTCEDNGGNDGYYANDNNDVNSANIGGDDHTDKAVYVSRTQSKLLITNSTGFGTHADVEDKLYQGMIDQIAEVMTKPLESSAPLPSSDITLKVKLAVDRPENVVEEVKEAEQGEGEVPDAGDADADAEGVDYPDEMPSAALNSMQLDDQEVPSSPNSPNVPLSPDLNDRDHRINITVAGKLPVNEFTQNNLLFNLSFPHLFITGEGFETTGSINRKYVAHLTRQFSGQFGRDVHFLFLCLNQAQRHATTTSAAARVKNNSESFQAFADFIKDEEFQELLRNAKANPKSQAAKRVLQLVGPHVKSVGRKQPFGPLEKESVTARLYGYSVLYGPAFCFLTFAPNDNQMPCQLRLSFAGTNNESFPATIHNLESQRQMDRNESNADDDDNDDDNDDETFTDFLQSLRNGNENYVGNAHVDIPINYRNLQQYTADNPAAMAEVLKIMIDIIFDTILGIGSIGGLHGGKKTRVFKDESIAGDRWKEIPAQEKGIFSYALAMELIIEAQARNTLHGHALIWASISPYLLQALAEYPFLVEKIAKAIDSIFTNELPIEKHIERYYRKELGKKYHDPSRAASLFEPKTPSESLHLRKEDLPSGEVLYDDYCIEVASTCQYHLHKATCHKGPVGHHRCRLGLPCLLSDGKLHLF